jgi:hypothetical protein
METHYEKVAPPQPPCFPCSPPAPPPPASLSQLTPNGPLFLQVLKKISRYIQEQNEKIFAPRGLLLTDPVERGMRVISFLALLCDSTELPIQWAPWQSCWGKWEAP